MIKLFCPINLLLIINYLLQMPLHSFPKGFLPPYDSGI